MRRVKISITFLIDMIRVSFISLVPFYILSSFLILIVELLKQSEMCTSFFILDDLNNDIKLMGALLPMLLNISISYHMATSYYLSVNRFLTIILSLLTYMCVDNFINEVSIKNYILPQSFVLAMIIPLMTTFLLAWMVRFFKHYEKKLSHLLSSNITTMIVYIIPFSMTFFIVSGILAILSTYLNIETNFVLVDENQESLLLFIRTIASNALWLFGIHGTNFFDSLINVNILNHAMYPNFTYGNFFNLFIILGGSGAGVSLVIAIFMASKDKHTTFIGKMSIPFVIFNINEILIFGIPIFMNFSLIIPFVLVPTVNFLLSYLFLSYTDVILFADMYIPWTTPVLINMFLATDGNILAVLFQLFLVALGTLIYIPFIKKYTCTQSSTISFEKMARKLDVNSFLETTKDIRFQEAQSSLIKSHHNINEIIETINQNSLMLYYQPKIEVKKDTCTHFEALLRVKDKEGNVQGPDFIIDIENSGLASVIDIWVCKEAKKDLDLWAKEGFYPHICVNIFPHTLEDKSYVNKIIKIFEGYSIGIEIIERHSSLNQKVIDNIHLLKKNNFRISLDDLGVGYTNFSMLYEMPLDIVKIDKKIIEFTKTPKGLSLYETICQLCSNLNLQIVLEGIETQEEYERLLNDKIDFIQGWYYSKAIPFNEVEDFSKTYNSKNK